MMVRVLKEIQFASPLRKYFFHRNVYNFTPAQLWFICSHLSQTSGIAGSVAEIGCAQGASTVYFDRHMRSEGNDKAYYAVDTFSGFVDKDVAHEIEHRGKSRAPYESFRVNSKRWFDATMRENGVTRVTSIQADVNEFDLGSLAPLSLCLLDVDLYRPMKKALGELYDALSPGGVMIVDDCNPNDTAWDGADQAYKEFMAQLNAPPHVEHEKLGVVWKPVG